jgi:hypothetical protein
MIPCKLLQKGLALNYFGTNINTFKHNIYEYVRAYVRAATDTMHLNISLSCHFLKLKRPCNNQAWSQYVSNAASDIYW